MRAAWIVVVLVLGTLLVPVNLTGVGLAQSAGPQGDDFNSTSFTAPFKVYCDASLAHDCANDQGPLSWSLDANSSGSLRLWSLYGSIEGADPAGNNAHELVLQAVNPGSDYVVDTKLIFPSTSNATSPVSLGQTAGLIVFQDADHFIYVGRQFSTTGASQIRFVAESGGQDLVTATTEPGIISQPVYLRIVKVQNTYQASWSTNGSAFTPVNSGAGSPPASYSASFSAPRIGLFAWGGTNSQVNTNMLAGDFDWFHVESSSGTLLPTATPRASAAPAVVPTPTLITTATPVKPAPTPKSHATKKTCKTKWVTKKVHGKKKRVKVRVCRKAKAKPKPKATVTRTATPTNTPAPTATPSNILYETSFQDGMAGWSQGGTGKWSVDNGTLHFDGTGASTLIAPVQVTTSDYAIEAKMQLVREGVTTDFSTDAVGLLFRANGPEDVSQLGEQPGIQAGYLGTPAGTTRLHLAIIGTVDNYPSFVKNSPDFVPGTDWHTYRIEVRGNNLSLYIDGRDALDYNWNKDFSGTHVGLIAIANEARVASYKVETLP